MQFTEEIPSAQSTLQPTANAEYLAAWGKATYTAMAQADSEAVWVLDGWFANANGEPWFWCGANKTHAQHYLSQGNDPIATTKRSQKLQRGQAILDPTADKSG